MRRLIPHILLLFLLAFGLSHAIATERERITPENIDRLTEIASVGRGTVEQIFWHPDDERLFVATPDGVYIHDGFDLSAEPTFLQTPLDLAFQITPDGDYLIGRKSSRFGYFVSKQERLDIWIWNLRTRELEFSTQNLFPEYAALPPNIQYIRRLPNGQTLLLVSSFNKVYLWDLNAPYSIEHLPLQRVGSSQTFIPPVLSPDGRWLAQCYDGGTVQIWDTSTWQTTAVFQIPFVETDAYGGNCVRFSPDNSHIMTIFQNRSTAHQSSYSSVVVWSLTNNMPVSKWQLPQNSFPSFAPDGELYAIASERIPSSNQHTVQLINLESGETEWQTQAWGFEMTSGGFNYEQGVFFSTGHEDDQGPRIRMFDLASGDILWETSVVRNYFFSSTSDGQFLAIGSAISRDSLNWYRTATVLSVSDLRTGQVLSQTYEYTHDIYDPAFSPDSRYLAMGDKNTGLRLFDTITGELRTDFEDISFMFPRVLYDDLRFIDNQTVACRVSSTNGSVAAVSWNVETGDYVDSPFPSQLALPRKNRVKSCLLV